MRILAIMLLATAFATPASAQDAPEAPASERPFTGFRVEGLLGWDHTEILDDDEGALLYGIGIGYDYQTGRAVLGLEAEASDSNNNGCLSDLINPGDRLCNGTGRDLYIGARAGLIVSRNVLLFAKAGYVNTRFTSEYDPGAGGPVTSAHFNMDGLRVGGGAEFAIGRNFFIRAEGRYTDYHNGGNRGALLGAFGFRF
ncbi:MAG TPA: porin family protein [Allosphingosinicella sp.]|nr:porin family protein [Allosphingosinicella sp.]